MYSVDRPILPASEVKSRATPDGVHRGSVLVEPFKQLPKRKQVTAVACRPCKARKSKCNGARPTCVACIKRGQPDDCEYDINSDQRRTAALKDRIQELRKETDDLKSIIVALTRDRDDSNVHQVVEDLVLSGFLDVATAAQLLRDRSESPDSKEKPLRGAMDGSTAYSGSPMSSAGSSSTASWLAVMQGQQIAQAVYQNSISSYAATETLVSPTTTGAPATVGQYWQYQQAPHI